MKELLEKIDALKKEIDAFTDHTRFSGNASSQISAVKDSLIWHAEALAKKEAAKVAALAKAGVEAVAEKVVDQVETAAKKAKIAKTDS
jgi:hypothetical protein